MYNYKNLVIFSDFDGTISCSDVINTFLAENASSKWLEIEKMWEDGVIGSKECIERQLKCLPKFSESKFDEFVNSIEIDKTFKDFVDSVNAENIELFIVSDGFYQIINKILTNNKIFGVKILSNGLDLVDGEFIPNFPNWNPHCLGASGNCKCQVIKKYGQGKEKIYVGDGLSDVCAIKNADVIFAKSRLAEYCEENSILYNSFSNFEEIKEKVFNIEENYVNN